jgi:CheY-like chemotaxis protein
MKTILVIDDEISIRQLLDITLNLHGFKTITAENGAIGLQLAKKQIPDLIICDLAMPEMNGYEVLKAIRKEPKTSNIPFIFLSASTNVGVQNIALALGANCYLTKPLLPNDLLNLISIYLQN